ncbi:MAG: hypothetical protein ABIR10_18445 [Dokdonella sp.]
MKRSILIILLASCNFASAQNVLLGKTLIGKGDSLARVRYAAGEPSRRDQIAGDEFTPAMEIWIYRRDDYVVTLWLVGGKVVKAAEEHKQGVDGGSAMW